MQKGNNFQTFIDNFAKAVKTHGVKELNDALENIMVNNNNKHRDEIDYLLTIISDGYGVTKRTLKTARSAGNLKQAKSIAFCLLHFGLKLPCRHIATRIFCQKAHGNVWQAINNFNTLNEKVKEDRLFKEKYDYYHNKLVEYIKNKQELKII